jgi:hypothetical protein
MDFIGDLGGVKDIMLQIAGWIVGSYAAFHSSWSIIASLYMVKLPQGNIFRESRRNDPNTPDLFKLKLPLRTRLLLWLTTTKCGCLYKCCLNGKQEKYLEIMEKGAEKQEEDFDIYQIIQESKKLRFELDLLKEKNNLTNDPDFTKINVKTLINLEEPDENY